jgi:hypothetical protein
LPPTEKELQQMTLKEISNNRLCSQKVASPEFKTSKEIVGWMGAMQAQDYSMAKWAIGVRLIDPVEKSIEASIDIGEILRIHVLRPTWHFISADDIYWMLKLSAPKIKSSLKSRHKGLGLNESVIRTTQTIMEKKLLKESSVTREELADEFTRANIRTDENRLSHILFRAELDGLVCSGPLKNKKLTYCLLKDRVPYKNDLPREEALAELAKRYFSSRCPATLEDFIWWSNLSVTDGRNALNSIKPAFLPEKIKEVTYWIPDSYSGQPLKKGSVHLLPAYDEFLISYRNRSSSLSSSDNKRTVSNNGIFYPAIVIDGQVVGLWKRTTQKDKIFVKADFFKTPDDKISKMVEMKSELFGQFLGKEINFSST